MGGNVAIEKKGLEWLERRLRETEGWEVSRTHKCGYDLKLSRGSETRFVEVKVTEKEDFTDRWLEEKEMAALESHRDAYFVYLISAVNSAQPKLRVLDYTQLQTRKRRVVTMQWFNFRP